jgi:hypothetical protein
VEKEAKEANSEPENLARKPHKADPQRLDFNSQSEEFIEF